MSGIAAIRKWNSYLKAAVRILWEEQLPVLKDTFSEAQTILRTLYDFWVHWVYRESDNAQK